MTVGRSVLPPKYDPELVECVVLEEVLRLHPERLTVTELSLKIVGDPEDDLEAETAIGAIHNLRASGLVRYRNDDRLVEPIHALLRYVELLGSP
jgi:hypothetical protein